MKEVIKSSNKRRELYDELEKLHKEQRGWQRLVEDERLDYTILDKMSIEQLEEVIAKIKTMKRSD